MEDEKQGPKALTKNPLGPSGNAVAENVARLIGEKNLTFAALSKLLSGLGRPIPPLGLRKIVAKTRRVDADDLVALAVALEVSPITLLMPNTEAGRDEVGATGVGQPISAMALWRWLRADLPMQGDARLPVQFHSAAWPAWWLRMEVERQEKFHMELALQRAELGKALADPDRAEKLRKIFEEPDGDD